MQITRRHLLALTAAAPVLALSTRSAMAASPAVYNEGGLAVGGTDVVGYFTQGEPVSGNADITYDYMDVTWRFASEENRDMFAADPEKYAPQYGGYCAWAVSQGYTASTTPEAWKIVDGKLYLNYSRRIQRRWERDIPGNIQAADSNWPAVLA